MEKLGRKLIKIAAVGGLALTAGAGSALAESRDMSSEGYHVAGKEGTDQSSQGSRQQSSQIGSGQQEDARASMRRMTNVSDDVARDVRNVLADAVSAGAGGDIEDFVDYLVESDRERISAQLDDQEYRQAYQRFDEAWRNQFGSNFDWDSNESISSVFAFPVSSDSATQAQGSSEQSNVVKVSLPSSGQQQGSGTTLRLRDEGTITRSWKIDAPDSLTAQQLKSSLTRELNSLRDGRSSWPSSQQEAAKVVAMRILSTVSTDSQQSSSSQSQSGSQSQGRSSAQGSSQTP